MDRQITRTSFGDISYLHNDGDIPVIFLHGLGGTGNSWLRLHRHLRTDLEVYFLDLPGHGRSAKPNVEYTVDLQCSIIDEFLRENSVSPVAIAGSSYGGWLAAKLASSMLRPRYLFLLDSAGLNPSVAQLGKGQEFIEAAMAMSKYNNRTVIENIVRNNSLESQRLKQEELLSIRSKTHIIWGSMDEMIPVSYSRKFAEFIPSSAVHIIEGAGHLPHLTNSEEVSEIINRAFFE